MNSAEETGTQQLMNRIKGGLSSRQVAFFISIHKETAMPKSVEICQLVARAISHTTWNIPKIRDGDRWRKINNSNLVENPFRINGHDHYEDAIFRAKRIMEERGWNTELTDTKEQCHEHLYYQHYRLKCWKRS